MGEVIPLFAGYDNVIPFPGGAQIAPHPEMCGHDPSTVPDIPLGIVQALDKLIHKGRIDEGQAIELLDGYFDTQDDSDIVALSAGPVEVVPQDINQLPLF